MNPILVTGDIDLMPWDDLTGYVSPELNGGLVRLGLQRDDSLEGNVKVALVVQLEDQRLVVAQTSWPMFEAAFLALRASPLIDPDTAFFIAHQTPLIVSQETRTNGHQPQEA